MKSRDNAVSKSEFQVILENKLAGPATGPKSSPKAFPETFTENFPKNFPKNFNDTFTDLSSSDAAKDFMATLSSLFFSQGPVRQNVVNSYSQKPKDSQKETQMRKENSQTKSKTCEEPVVLAEVKREGAPKIKVKRSRTFDQVKALSTFVKFGEKEMNEFATDEEIKTAYRRLAKKYHPDAGAQNDLNFKIISAAYKKLIF